MEATEIRTIDQISAALAQPFPREALKQRSAGGGKALTYVEGHTVIHRLNSATGNQWDFRIISIESRDVPMPQKNRTDILMMATVEITIPGLGTRQHVGVQIVSPGSGEDLAKGCVTDALKKAATLYGVGLELYGPDYGSEENEPRPEPQVRAQTPQVRPSAAPTPIRQSPPATDGKRTWNDFWRYAKGKGLNGQPDVERVFGHELDIEDSHGAYLELQEISGDA